MISRYRTAFKPASFYTRMRRLKSCFFASAIAATGLITTGSNGVIATAMAHPPADHKPDIPHAEYIANEGVLVVDGPTKILFDPLFHNSYGNYRLPSEEQRLAILNGTPPYDGVDAMFISHAHGDHFSAEDALAWLANHPHSKLIAPRQAVEQLKAHENWKDKFEDRILSLSLEFGDPAYSIAFDPVTLHDLRTTGGSLVIDAVRIPHAGWPGRKDIENIVYRVSLGKDATVMHMGDADPRDEHYAPYDELWDKQETDLGFPPFWFFSSPQTHAILKDRLHIRESVGIHVPLNVPPGLEAAREQFGIDFFSEPGEWHPITRKEEKPSEH